MPVTKDTQLDYFMDVVLRQYCRATEECEFLYEEAQDLRNQLSIIYQENSDLRFRMKEAGLEVPHSDFITAEELAESNYDLI